MVWWRHKRYSWVFPSRRDRAASIDLHNLKMSPQWLKIWQEQKNKLPDTSSNPEGWHRQNYVWVFMLHIQKKNYRNAQSERLESGLNKHNLPVALWTHPEVTEFQTLCTWASSAASSIKAQQELLNFLFTGSTIALTCRNKVSALCTKKEEIPARDELQDL